MKQKTSYSVDEVREKVVKYCAYQERCHWEVEKKMNEYGLIPEAKDVVLMYLMEHNFLNEARFVESYIRGKINQKKWGKVKIKIELKKRKINDRMISDGFKKIDDTVYQENLDYWVKKRVGENSSSLSYQDKARLIRFLLQKGYEYEIIKERLSVLSQS